MQCRLLHHPSPTPRHRLLFSLSLHAPLPCTQGRRPPIALVLEGTLPGCSLRKAPRWRTAAASVGAGCGSGGCDVGLSRRPSPALTSDRGSSGEDGAQRASEGRPTLRLSPRLYLSLPCHAHCEMVFYMACSQSRRQPDACQKCTTPSAARAGKHVIPQIISAQLFRRRAARLG
jgi:hypothetical protein